LVRWFDHFATSVRISTRACRSKTSGYCPQHDTKGGALK